MSGNYTPDELTGSIGFGTGICLSPLLWPIGLSD